MSRKTKTPRAAKTAPVKTAPAKTPRAAKTPMVAVTKTAATITVAALARELNISALAARNRMRRRFGTLDVANVAGRIGDGWTFPASKRDWLVGILTAKRGDNETAAD